MYDMILLFSPSQGDRNYIIETYNSHRSLTIYLPFSLAMCSRFDGDKARAVSAFERLEGAAGSRKSSAANSANPSPASPHGHFGGYNSLVCNGGSTLSPKASTSPWPRTSNGVLSMPLQRTDVGEENGLSEAAASPTEEKSLFPAAAAAVPVGKLVSALSPLSLIAAVSYAAAASSTVSKVPSHTRFLRVGSRISAAHRPQGRRRTPRNRFPQQEPETAASGRLSTCPFAFAAATSNPISWTCLLTRRMAASFSSPEEPVASASVQWIRTTFLPRPIATGTVFMVG